MSNSYVLGRGRENNLIVKLRKKGWFAIRGSGSKAGMVIVEGKKYFPIDIVAVKKDGKYPQVLFIQVSKYFSDIDSIEKKEWWVPGRQLLTVHILKCGSNTKHITLL